MSDAAALAAAAAAAPPLLTVGTNGAAPPWYADFDEITRGFFQNRGLDKKTAPEAAMQLSKDYRELHSKAGLPADRILRIPDAADAEGWKAVHQKLGVPADPAQYDFTAVKRADGSVLDEHAVSFMRATAQALNLPAAAAPQLAAAIIKRDDEARAATAGAEAVARALAGDQINANWGPNREINNFYANRAAMALGLTPEFIAAVPGALYAGFMEQLREAGTRMGEAKLLGHGVDGGSLTNGPATREGAIARLAEMKKIPGLFDRMRKEPELAKEWDNLNQMQVAGR